MKQNVCTVGIDLAKKILHLVGTDITGKIVWRKRLTRHALVPFLAQVPPVPIGMEACGGAHYWARQFRHQGHTVKLMDVSHLLHTKRPSHLRALLDKRLP